ncbi:BspA family leucine-rich repeat surface protein [Sphingobacterium spiritivorum]|uniref:BspA family leucine-rich repeat surface protein n=1 Tax=Sphingobacterium spiritivorum TaxID=258 RepID=UPI003DA5447D
MIIFNIKKPIFFLFLLTSLKSFGIPPALINSDTETTRKSIPVTQAGSQIIAGTDDNFITVWDMSKPGSSINQLTFNLAYTAPVPYSWTASGGSTGSGTTTGTITGLPAGEIITLSLEPANLKAFNLFVNTNILRIIDVSQWGTVQWNSMFATFLNCANLNITATDMPDLSQVTNAQAMFAGCSVLNGPANIGDWNTSNITNMSQMFARTYLFNQNIGNWNTSNVTNMVEMFTTSLIFNQNIGNWDTSKVTDMNFMFGNAPAFNQDIGNWNTANVLSMHQMFRNAIAFNQNLGNWQLNPNVNMDFMLFNAGTDCVNYSATLRGWANNPNTPNGRYLNAQGRQYSPNAAQSRTTLTTGKGWTITGDSPSGQNCGLPQTITVTDMVKTYGDVPFVPAATASSGLEVSYVSADSSIAEAYQDSADANKWKLKIKKAGEVNITAKQDGNENYSPASDVIFKLTIGKAPLTVTGDALSKEYGTADPALTYTATGFVNGDNQTALTGALSRATGEATGTYAVTQGTLNAANYTITYTGASFTITPATGDFVTVWDLGKNTSWPITAIKFDITTSSGGAVDYFWKASGGTTGIGTIAANSTSALITGLPANEIITLNLKPTHLKAIKVAGTNKGQLVDIAQWGTAQWSTMKEMLRGASFMKNITATDIPDLSKVTNMAMMFQECNSLNGPANIGSWNTENVTDMSSMFVIAQVFNQDIGSWNTEKVTNMNRMFLNAEKFDQNIGNWNTANVTDMGSMFANAKLFNSDISNWNTSNVTNMRGMFNSAGKFNQNIGGWNTAKVTDMWSMFSFAYVFNQDIGSWNTANVTTMNSMFSFATAFNQDIGSWNTAKVTTMRSMFLAALKFNQNIGNWNTANVTDMYNMFAGGSPFNQDIGNWNTANVTDMYAMFQNTLAFNQDISSWNTAKVTNMVWMFNNAKVFNQNIGSWQLHPTVNMDKMLDNAGMDCQNYSFTLQGWANNQNTPSGRNLGALGRQYGTNAVAARTALTTTKGWTITGDSPSGQSCGLDQTITAADMVKTYGDAAFAPTAAASSGLEVSYVSADNSIAEAFQDTADANKWKLKIKKAGVVNITAQQAGNDTYAPASDVIFKLTIGKAPLTVTGDALSKEYGTTDPALTYTATGFVNGDNQTALTGALSRATGEAVGIYAIIQGTLQAENYTITYTGADFNITKAALNIVADTKTREYGTIDPALTYTAIGFVNSDDQTVITGTLSRTIGENVGTYAITQGTLNAANYTITYTGADFSITPATGDFVTVWSASSVVFYIKTSTGGSVDYFWKASGGTTGRGTFAAGSTTVSVAGLPANQTITLNLKPDNLKAFSVTNSSSALSLIDVAQWGTAKWSTMVRAFSGVKNLNITAADIPDFSSLTDLSFMFEECSSLNGPANIDSWNTANVTNMGYMFAGAKIFNQNIGSWNMEKAQDIRHMFRGAAKFNQDIGSWNTSKVLYAFSMFENATEFNQDIGNWDLPELYDISAMFKNATSFNQNIDRWNFSKVRNMIEMFAGAVSFNQPIGSWNTSSVVNMNGMFTGATAFNQDISSWNTEKVTRMDNMFNGATDFNQNIGKWKLKSAVNMVSMLDNSGMDCQNYSFTLNGWANNPGTPSGRVLGAAGRQYGINVVPARTTLTTTKGWTITGDSPSGQNCGLDQTITAADMVKTYGDAAFVPIAAASSGLEVSYVSADNSIAEAFQDTADGNTWKIKIKKAGQVNITAQQNGNGIYNPAADITFKLTINKAPLAITANALSKEWATADPVLTYTAAGFVNNDDQTALTGALSRDPGEAIATYAITQGTLNAENYSITYTGASFTISASTDDFVTVWDMSKWGGDADPSHHHAHYSSRG